MRRDVVSAGPEYVQKNPKIDFTADDSQREISKSQDGLLAVKSPNQTAQSLIPPS